MLKDEDRIFQNLYNDSGADIDSAKLRNDWSGTKDILEEILISEKQNYIKICEKRKRNKNPFSVVINGILELIIQNIILYKFVKRYRPDYLLGTDVAIAYIGKLRNIPSFVFNEDDYEINKLFCKATYPFIDYIIAPEITSVGKYTDKKISYNFILIIFFFLCCSKSIYN